MVLAIAENMLLMLNSRETLVHVQGNEFVISVEQNCLREHVALL